LWGRLFQGEIVATTKANLNRIHKALERIVEHSEIKLGRKMDEVGTRAEKKLGEMLEKLANTIEGFEEKIIDKMNETKK
jgi:hypothetical protein